MMKPKSKKFFSANLLCAIAVLLLSSSCASIIVNPMLDPLTISMQKQTDLELLQEGAPSLLLLLDGLIADDPENEKLLMTATRLYGAYAAILYEDGQTERAVNMSIKARDYGVSLLNRLPALKSIKGQTRQALGEIQSTLQKTKPNQIGNLFWGAFGWATWIQFQEGAPTAMADLPIVESIMLRVIELDESFYYGGAHIFLGSYYGSRPQVYGGKPDASRKHFERALEINKRQFLLTQVAYAQTYARMMYDRGLYLKLLSEVLEQPLTDSDMASSNKLAKVTAARLIQQVDEFF